jgi:hypothetical protein
MTEFRLPADVNDPANGRPVFHATYHVRWKPRLTASPLQILGEQMEASQTFDILVTNQGPDKLLIAGNIDQIVASIFGVDISLLLVPALPPLMNIRQE